MNNDQILAVSIEARLAKIERDWKKVPSIVGKGADGAEKRAQRATQRIEQHFSGMGSRVASIGKGMAAGFVGGLVAGGVMGIFDRVGDEAKRIAEIGDEAKRAGLGIEEFQELKYVAEQNRIGVDALTDGIKELNLRADEFIVTGGGSAAEAFQRLGYDAATLKTKLEDPSALFTEIIGKLGHLDRAAQIRIADELFGGTGGERFVQLIEQGEDAINRTRQEARDLGVVMDDQLIAKANELDRAFQTVATTVGSTLQQAIVNVGWAFYDFMQQFQAFENRTNVSLQQSMRDLGRERVDLEHAILEQQSFLNNMEPDIPGAIGGPRAGFEMRLAEMRSRMDEILAEETRIGEVLDSRTPVQPPRTQITVTNSGDGDTPTTPGSGGGLSASSMREQRDAAAELIAELRNELAVLGMSEAEQRINAELRRAGAFATDDQKASIRSLVTEIEAERASIQRLEDAMENVKGMAKDFLGGLLTDLRNGVDGATALANAFGRLADKLLDMALDAIINSLFENLLGTATGGLFGWLGLSKGGVVEAATGGYIRGPGTGTSDSIPARLSDGEYVVNAAATARNRDLLDAINSGKIAAFATGGLVGDSPVIRPANDNRTSANDNAPVVTINAPITVEGGAGTPEQNADLAKQIARQMEQTMRGVAADEMRRAMRPGNIANTRSRT